ncbi:phage terminase small subunit P27 family [Nocardiopsis sp. NPDC007018]|uniref:phage terminase small subunit P27 family n=1 Tax=Nocardiopsis sp. NPDC007018 TaxID=3155721 RepID=UPI0033E4CB88
MGERGRKSKPTSLKILHGDREDRINRDEPLPGQGEVVAPAWIVELDEASTGEHETALGVWNRLAPDLARKGVLTPWDVDQFAVFCDAVVRHREATRAVDREGALVEGQKGNLVRNPGIQIARDYADLMVKVGSRFGLTPGDRADLKIERETAHGGADRLLS